MTTEGSTLIKSESTYREMTEDSNGRLVLVKLDSSQINQYWKSIKEILELLALPVEKKNLEYYTNVYKALLIGRMQCWIAVGGDEVRALALTCIQTQIGGGKDLLIYSIFGYGGLAIEDYMEGLRTLRLFAKSNSCDRVVGYSKEERIIRVANSLGGETKYTFIEIPVEDV